MIPETSRITLEVTPSNNKGLNFYKTLGFKQAENRFMELTLKD
jgi:ribosomal protein S18 acetylase RimI-like enzyme